LVKCEFDIGKYVPQAHGVSIGAGPVGGGGGGVVLWKGWWALAGLGQENLLGFLLFWIGSYALIHGTLCLFYFAIMAGPADILVYD
jgi:hypothetical protein